MPRGRSRGKRERKPTRAERNKPPVLDVDLSDEKQEPNQRDIKEDVQDIEEYLLNLDEMHEFLRVKANSMAVCYLIPTTEILKEDSVRQIKTNIVEALQKAAEGKRMHINVNRIRIKTYPKGAKTYVKAWFHMYDATGRGAHKIEKKQRPPREVVTQ